MSFTLANNLSVGNVIKIGNKSDTKTGSSLDPSKLYEILSKEHVKPGKGPAYMQFKCKNYFTGKKTSIRPSGSDRYEKMNIYIEEVQPLYFEGQILVCMDKDSYEKRIDLNLLGEQKELFSLDYKIIVYLCEDIIIKASLPDEIIVEILETTPYQKGSRSKLGTKKAKISENISIDIPSNLDSGHIIIKTSDLSFVKRHTPNV